ncbi:MAG: hypothetical protein KatS3mg057_0206 [Herpetosiphonaceae bacterium]|nr:MAG: hypothetical protein KatS3mg057_0206 [Herpetosiphonaceae bacterium]
MTDSAIEPSLVQPGMDVVGADGVPIGQVSDVREDRVLVGRQIHPAIAVPWPFIQYVSGDQVVLTVPSSRVDQMGWEVP